MHLVRYLLVVFLLLTALSWVDGQDFKREFRNAKELFEEHKYNLALEAFKTLIVYDRRNPYSEYASFYTALCAYHLGYHAVAKSELIQLRKLHEDWDQIQEVNYWLAKIYFDQYEFFQGMLVLNEMSGSASLTPEVAADIALMKQHYIAQIQDPEILVMALEEYPGDSDVARALAKILSREAFNPSVLAQFDSLVSLYNFNREDFPLDVGPVSVKKDRYVISLLFPFLASTLSPSPTAVRPNQSVLDLYLGMKMAADTLDKQGVHLDLRSYDTERSIESLRRLLATEELKSSDLLVGPIFSEEMKLVRQFSLENEINMISPVSNSVDFMGDNPFSLLFQPSHETLGRRAAEILSGAVRNKNCIVYFGDLPKDSVMAFSFMKRALELGLNIVLAEEHRRETASRILVDLTTATEYDEFRNPKQFSLKLDSIGSIYVASDDALIYSKVNSSLTTRGDSILVVGSEKWIAAENTSVNFENFERLNILLAASNFTSPRNPAFLSFRKKFLARHGVYPSTYALLGYEFTLFIGHALRDHGTYFQQGMNGKGFSRGWLYEGYDYNGSRDNQYVPFVFFQHGELHVFNKQ